MSCVEFECYGATFQNCFVACVGVSACYNAKFINSEVLCFDARACENAEFESSDVSCAGGEGFDDFYGACKPATFRNSNVTCNGVLDLTCGSATFLDCSCCDGKACGQSTNVCSEEFCSTCQEPGNPFCAGFPTPPPNKSAH